jgi:Leu/Phe-tRNA-protein transferase
MCFFLQKFDLKRRFLTVQIRQGIFLWFKNQLLLFLLEEYQNFLSKNYLHLKALKNVEKRVKI